MNLDEISDKSDSSDTNSSSFDNGSDRVKVDQRLDLEGSGGPTEADNPRQPGIGLWRSPGEHHQEEQERHVRSQHSQELDQSVRVLAI